MNILKAVLDSNRYKFCIVCSRKLPDKAFAISDSTAGICSECSSGLHFTKYGSSFDAYSCVDYLLSPLEYKDTTVTVLRNLKFLSHFKNGEIINLILVDFLQNYPHLRDYDAVIPVPISKERRYERGFNQSEIFAKAVSDTLNVPLDKTTLIKTKHTPAQSSLNFFERLLNTKDAFAVSTRLQSKNILLVDDIYTTGSTMASCAETLKKAGAEHIVGISASISINRYKKYIYNITPDAKPLLQCRNLRQIKNHFIYKNRFGRF